MAPESECWSRRAVIDIRHAGLRGRLSDRPQTSCLSRRECWAGATVSNCEVPDACKD